MKKKKIVITIMSAMLLSNILFVGCGNSKKDVKVPVQTKKTIKTNENNQDNKNKQSQDVLLDIQDKKIKSLTEERDYYKKYVKDMTSVLPEDKLQKLVDKEWAYNLTINKINFPSEGVIEIGDNNFDIVLTENKEKFSVIPDDLSDKVRLKKTLSSCIHFEDKDLNDIKMESNSKTGDNVTIVTNSFKNVPNGTILKFKIDDELKTKLNIKQNELQIKIK